MSLELANTVLNAAPYFDDYDQTKNYHRILFRPAVAVQARELTQLQTVLQNQIERFGNHIFKDGSVVQGCSIEYIRDLEYVGVEDQFSDDSDLSLVDDSLLNAVVIGQTNDVHALIVSSRTGFIRQEPGRFYIRYTKPGSNGSRVFAPGESLKVYGGESTYIENVVITVANAAVFANTVGLVLNGVETGNTANVIAKAVVVSVDSANNKVIVNNVRRTFNANGSLVLNSNTDVNSSISSVVYDLSDEIATIKVLTSNTDGVSVANADISGFAFGAHVSEGIVYHKGFFVRVDSHNVVVNEANSSPAGYVLGFITDESIVQETADESLYDNALGYANANAPGAHRLKLSSEIVARAANSLSNTEIFFPVVEFSNTGAAFERTDPQYATIGDEIAKRTYEESGHYVIKPFGVSSAVDPADADSLIFEVSPGLAYVKGRRNELLTNIQVSGRRGTDTVSYDEQIVSMSFGNYVSVNEIRGHFPSGSSVALYSVAQDAISESNTPSGANNTIEGSVIGTANIRELLQVSGTKGDANTESYKMYLFNIVMSNSSLSFANVGSIVYNPNTTHRAFADIQGTNGLQESTYAPQIFSLGAKAVKSLENANGDPDSNYYYNCANTTASLVANGTVTFQVPAGGGILGFTDGSDASEAKLDLVLMAEAVSANVATDVELFANGYVTGTNIGLTIFPGEAIRHGANTWLVLSKVSNTALQTMCSAAAAPGQTISRLHYEGSHVSIDGTLRTLTVTANNEAVINLGTAYAAGPYTAFVRFYALQNQGAELKKNLRRSTSVLIDLASSTGPFNLGIPDAFRLAGVYIANGSGVSASADLGLNLKDDFELLNGQQDTHYDHSSVVMRDHVDQTFYDTKRVLVEFDHFVANNTTGKGFFSVDSYPVDDAFDANTSSTIRTYEIPVYSSSGQSKIYDLRDSIDFRPYRGMTANVTSTITNATLNPGANLNFQTQTTEVVPFPGQNFECNFTHYLGRKDVMTITPGGEFIVVEGIPSQHPRTPEYPSETVSVANIDIPPYPTLADDQRVVANRPEYTLRISVQNHKRYTMKDISALEQRISRLEYYTSLNALEKAAADLKIPSSDGVDRFKNGIFVDPFNSHAFGRVDHPQYKIAIDEKNSYGRPFFQPEFFDVEYDAAASNNVVRTGDFLMLDYVEEAYISQDYANSTRNLSGAPPAFDGTLILSPNRWSEVEVLAHPVSVTTVDRGSIALTRCYAPHHCIRYGWWRSRQYFTEQDLFHRDRMDLDFWGKSAPRLRLRDRTFGTVSSSYTTEQNTTTSVEVQSYIRPREVAFRALGLKPYTSYFTYIDDVDVTEFVAEGELANEAATDDSMVTRTAMWGSVLTTNSRGEVEGKISVPSGRFKTGRHTVKLLSARLGTETLIQISSAAALFEVDINYNEPVPPIIVEPPSLPVPGIGPLALFNHSTSVAGRRTNYARCDTGSPELTHSITFTDASIAGSTAIVSWAWNFGNGSTYTGQNPPAQTYANNRGIQTYKVTLTVTDVGGLISTYTSKIDLWVSRTPPPPPPVNPPALTANVILTPYQGSQLVSGGVVSGAGAVTLSVTAVPTTKYTGGYFVWDIDVNSGVAVSAPTITGATTDIANNVVKVTLSNTGTVFSNLSINATYWASGTSVGNTTIVIRMEVTPAVATAPAPAPVQQPVGSNGGGGCVAVDSYIDSVTLAKDVQVGFRAETTNVGDIIELFPCLGVGGRKFVPGVRITTVSGAVLRCSLDTPFNLKGATQDLEEGTWAMAGEMLGQDVLVDHNGMLVWELVTEVKAVPSLEIVPLNFGGRSFAAGDDSRRRIYSHNMVKKSEGTETFHFDA